MTTLRIRHLLSGTVLSLLFFSRNLVPSTCPAVLFLLSCPGRSVLSALSCCHIHCQVPNVLSYQNCHGCLPLLAQPGCPVSVISLLSCACRPVFSSLSCLHNPDCLLCLSCPSFPVRAVLSQVDFPSCFYPAVFSGISYSQCLCPRFPVFAFMSSCPVISVLSRMPFHRCPVLAFLYRLSCLFEKTFFFFIFFRKLFTLKNENAHFLFNSNRSPEEMHSS